MPIHFFPLNKFWVLMDTREGSPQLPENELPFFFCAFEFNDSCMLRLSSRFATLCLA